MGRRKEYQKLMEYPFIIFDFTTVYDGSLLEITLTTPSILLEVS